MDIEYDRYVGIDWATEEHQACVLDKRRKKLWERVVKHEGTAIAEFADALARMGPPELTAIGIETPRGAIIETLLERGFHVYHLNPKQMDRFRDRHSVAGAKDDRRDAYVIGDALGTDLHLFRRVNVDDPKIIELRELVRADDDVANDFNRTANRCRELVHRYYPQFLELCPSMDEPWAWSIWKLAPTPTDARRLKLKSVAAVLSHHRIRRLDAAKVIQALQAPAVYVVPGTAAGCVAALRFVIPRLEVLAQQRKEIERAISVALDALPAPAPGEGQKSEHRDVDILLSLPGVGKKVAATVLVEAPQALAEADYHALRALSGVAPVTEASGKRKNHRAKVRMRHAANNRLRNAAYHWARVSAQCDPAATAAYAALRARSHSHGRALRSVADRNLRILAAMLRTRTLYDATRFAKTPTESAT